MLEILELQEQLIHVSEASLSVDGQFIVEHFGCGRFEARCLSECLTIAVRARSEYIDLYARLSRVIIDIDPFRMVYFREALLDKCVSGLLNNWSMPSQDGHAQSLLRFVYLLLNNDVFDISDIGVFLEKLTPRAVWSGLKPQHLLFWLGPELKAHNQKLFEHLNSGSFEPFHVSRNSISPYADVFMKDDIARLMDVPLLYNEISEFDNIWVGDRKFDIGVAAARFSSLECFKYWMLGHARELDLNQLAMNAVIGGNPEIIRLCEQLGCQFESHAMISVRYHKYELFEWLWHKSNEDAMELMFEAVISGNLHVLEVLRASGQNMHGFFHNRSTMLHYAVVYGMEISVRYLIERVHVDVNAKEKLSVFFLFT